MRKVLLALLITALAATGFAEAKPEGKIGTEKDVIVGRLAKPTPEEDQAAWDFVWNEFSTRPETRWFERYPGENWRRNYEVFATALVTRAKEEKYEAEALKKCLKKLPAESIAKAEKIGYLPIRAYQTTRGAHEVWVIFCLWEDVSAPLKVVTETVPPLQADGKPAPGQVPQQTEKLEWLPFGHIRMFTYDLKSTELIGFVTCD